MVKNRRYPKQIKNINSLLEPDQLKTLLNKNISFSVEQLNTLGYSGSKFYSINPPTPQKDNSFSYILKQTILSEDWFSQRLRDKTGREGKILIEPDFSDLYDIFNLPYLAVAIEDGSISLLMNDLSESLLPDERKPISRETESKIIDHLAKMHAVFWENKNFSINKWLIQPSDYFYIMGPLDHEQNSGPAQSSRSVDKMINDGWKAAKDLLPDHLIKILWQSPKLLLEKWNYLPKTLLHGDTKLANFAVKRNGDLALFDWAFVGYGPCTFDIGWYIAVNASRLSQSKEDLFEEFKYKLEKHLDSTIEPEMWLSLKKAGILCGALMLLWSKALGVKNKRAGAEKEWEWWCLQLERILH